MIRFVPLNPVHGEEFPLRMDIYLPTNYVCDSPPWTQTFPPSHLQKHAKQYVLPSFVNALSLIESGWLLLRTSSLSMHFTSRRALSELAFLIVGVPIVASAFLVQSLGTV